ncbi:hypothetical protein CFP56_022227 [Quercus suber]|uniref:Uncharacterized protein n=1 Tax=Quercus suber TaxID=58331 RepID=A0AAW0KBE8_QUESU
MMTEIYFLAIPHSTDIYVMIVREKRGELDWASWKWLMFVEGLTDRQLFSIVEEDFIELNDLMD